MKLAKNLFFIILVTSFSQLQAKRHISSTGFTEAELQGVWSAETGVSGCSQKYHKGRDIERCTYELHFDNGHCSGQVKYYARRSVRWVTKSVFEYCSYDFFANELTIVQEDTSRDLPWISYPLYRSKYQFTIRIHDGKRLVFEKQD